MPSSGLTVHATQASMSSYAQLAESAAKKGNSQPQSGRARSERSAISRIGYVSSAPNAKCTMRS